MSVTASETRHQQLRVTGLRVAYELTRLLTSKHRGFTSVVRDDDLLAAHDPFIATRTTLHAVMSKVTPR